MTDVFKMLAHAQTDMERGHKNASLIALCGLAGLRISEARAVRPSHFKVVSGNLTLEVRGKGDKRRVLPVSKTLFKLISQQYALNMSEDTVLCDLDDRTARTMITRIGREVGISRRVSSHDLRMTHATEVYNRTKDIRLVQQLLGHADTKTTTKYIEVRMDAMHAAVDFNG